jgi:hypothetical protein
MKLFELFDVGETEVCGVVNYLLLRSPELRDALIAVINDRTPLISLMSREHFSCTREWSNRKILPSGAKGRVDIVLEVDNAVIGIEAKIQAGLSDDQPDKYVDAVRKHAAALAEIRKSSIHAVIVLLLPLGQVDAAAKMLAEKKEQFSGVSLCILEWGALFEAWRVARVTDNVARFVLDELQFCVSMQTGSLADFSRLSRLIQAPLTESKHNAHHEFVSWLFPAFRGNRRYLNVRVNKPKGLENRTYLGYEFLAHPTDGAWGWYGFVSPEYVSDCSDEVPVFVLGTDFEIAQPSGINKAFEKITFTHPSFNWQTHHWWRIRFDRSWDRLDVWRENLRPMQNAAAEKLLASQDTVVNKNSAQ